MFKTNQVNEAVRKKENTERLEWIQNHVQCDGPAEVLHLMKTVFYGCYSMCANIELATSPFNMLIVLHDFKSYLKASFHLYRT